MRTLGRFSILFLTLLAVSPALAVVGYVNTEMRTGDTLFHNPLMATDNHISSLFSALFTTSYSPLQDEITISLWDPAANAFSVRAAAYPSIYGWLDPVTLDPVDFELLPGTGALLHNSAPAFTTTFVGTVLNHDGTQYIGSPPLLRPPAYSGPDGAFLLGDKAPIASSGVDIFLNIFGREPNDFEQVIKLHDTYTYLGGGFWDHNGIDLQAPSLAVGEAALFNIGPIVIPEPSVAALGLLGLGLARTALRRRVAQQ